MALPTSGTISASMINTELNRISTSSLSINNASAGGYGKLNWFSRQRPDKFDPDEYSEWYGYDHSAGGGGGTGSSGTNIFSFDPDNLELAGADRACMWNGDAPVTWSSPTNNWWDATSFLQGGRNAIRGWYSDVPFGGSSVRSWSGSRWSNSVRLCRIVP
jgi:hypothetical protein